MHATVKCLKQVALNGKLVDAKGINVQALQRSVKQLRQEEEEEGLGEEEGLPLIPTIIPICSNQRLADFASNNPLDVQQIY